VRRRQFLGSAASLATLATLAGCSGGPDGPAGEGTEVEIIPSNRTEERREVTVEVEATDGTLLLNHTYDMEPGTSDESRGVEDDVARVRASSPGLGEASTEYAPDPDLGCSRDGEDVQILVGPDDITFAYTC
jgi:hypothetical protein